MMKCAMDDFVLIYGEDRVRTFVTLAAVLMVAGCATANSGGPQASAAAANMPDPRTPDVFRKPPPVVGRWGFGVGYGGRY